MTQLWAIREKGRLWQKYSHDPVQLTRGPMSFWKPLPSKDWKKIFAIGGQVRGEIMRYARKSEEWAPYHPEKSMIELSFPLDGEWVVYVAYPEGTLLRSKADFSDAQQLTFPPMDVDGPRWSPDGKQIAFQGRTPNKLWKIYTVPCSGGRPQQLMSGDLGEAWPDWSPDGNRLVFAGSPLSDPATSWPTVIHLLDLKSNQVSVLPGSD
jgi:Tol biopolymer transport system component